ncbi:NosD domain-containing protein [Paenibacillus allorhizosphaerae]|uniref:Right handed beta helix domain-containing protein n=1 Tax=Paenibacillus allorhizosphaerae TaxID=2849866 RepID=A0ABM8V9Y9_9BACL|nr:NosD domain-containing protein [Paenibacillus allorhizosphaerae]CAG7614658.1 hypothetical protein PAECIP111802_00096 [Paenibacillus allorhizosphaerae]
MKSNDEQLADNRMTRRSMLASIGLAGTAMVAGASVWNSLAAETKAAGGTATVPIYNVKDYGAVGDGTTNDTAAIQSALNDAQTASFSHVVIPRGTYKTTAALRIFGNTRLTLEKGATVLRCHNSTILINGLNNVNFSGYNGHGNIIIEGGVWDCNVLQYPDPGNCFGLARGRNIVIRNLEVRDVPNCHAIDMNGCDNVLVDNCRFIGYLDPQTDQSSGLREAIQISPHLQVGFPYFGAFDGMPCRNVIVQNCYFGASGTAGTQAWPTGVGNHSSVHNVYNSNIKVYGNTFEGMTYGGVRSLKFTEMGVMNNRFIDCKMGVMLSNTQANTEGSKDADGVQSGLPQSGKNYIIQGNTFTGTVTTNIYCVGSAKDVATYAKVESVLIADNVFEQGPAANNCMTIRWTNDVTISGNVLRNQYRGIFLSYVSNCNIHDNTFVDMATEAVYTEEPDAAYRYNGLTANLIVHDNLIQRCGRTGIFIQSLDGFQVESNMIESPATETDNTRSGILAANMAKNGRIAGNRVKKAASGNQNQYGINVTDTCSDVQVTNNYAEGKTGRIHVAGAANFEGIWFHSTDGTRFIMTVDNNGSPVFTAG